MVFMTSKRDTEDFSSEQALWNAFIAAWAKYDAEPNAENWLAKQQAHNAWSVEYLRKVA